MCTGTSGTGIGSSGTSGSWADLIIAGSSLLSAHGNLSEGKSGAQMYGYRANQAEADAVFERGMGEVRANKIRKAGVLAQAEVRAGYGGSGIDVNSGTPLAVAEKLERNIGEDAIAQLLTGEYRARKDEQEAGFDRASASRTISGSRYAAARSLLAGTAALMDSDTKRDKWVRMQQQDFARTKRAEFTGFDDAGM